MTGALVIGSQADLPPEIADQINVLADATVNRDRLAEAVERANQVFNSAINSLSLARRQAQGLYEPWPEPLGEVISTVEDIFGQRLKKVEQHQREAKRAADGDGLARLQAARAKLVSAKPYDFGGRWADYRDSLGSKRSCDADSRAASRLVDETHRALQLTRQAITAVRRQLDPDSYQEIELARQAEAEAEQTQDEAQAELEEAQIRLASAEEAIEQAAEELDRRVINWLDPS